jgi:hypothetical protein
MKLEDLKDKDIQFFFRNISLYHFFCDGGYIDENSNLDDFEFFEMIVEKDKEEFKTCVSRIGSIKIIEEKLERGRKDYGEQTMIFFFEKQNFYIKTHQVGSLSYDCDCFEDFEITFSFVEPKQGLNTTYVEIKQN